MREQSHIELTRLAARAVGWPADLVDVLAEEAATPDRIHGLEIDGLGVKPMGYEAFSLTHFGRRVIRPGKGGGFVVLGYNWKRDATCPKLDLPDRRVIAHPENWRWPYTPAMRMQEPLYRLVNVKGINLAADEFTFPSAVAYMDWGEFCVGRIPAGWGKDAAEEALCKIVGHVVHWAQDLAQPFHAIGALLGGHAEFEGAQQELLLAQGEIAEVLAALTKKIHILPEPPVSFRRTGEDTSGDAYIAPSLLAAAMMKQEVRALLVASSIARAAKATIGVLRRAMEFYLTKPRHT